MGELLRKFVSESVKVYSCASCDFHLAKETDLISKLFQGQSGPAYLFNEVYNIAVDPLEQDRFMTTGKHRIKTIRCISCRNPVGWTYVIAYSQDQKYKEGKFIIERAYLEEIDNSNIEIHDCLAASHDLITKLNYFHQIKE